MADLSHQEQLQPSLLDRLTDDEPDKNQEPRSKRVLSLRKLRESVLRDLSWLLNAPNLTSVQDLSDYPEVPRSVVNYGMPDMSGHTASSIDVQRVEGLLKQAILDFEPRLLRNSLRVNLVVDKESMSYNSMLFEITGRLWALPMPLNIFLRTELDLEIGDVKVTEYSG